MTKGSIRKPISIQNPRNPAEVGQECIRRLNSISDPSAFILMVHLFTEHWMCQILLKFGAHRKVTSLTYAQKLATVSQLGKIPEKLVHNLKLLNELRNNLAHQIDFDITKMKLDYHPTNQHFKLSEYKLSYDLVPEQHHISNVLGVVFADTYMWLHRVCVEELGFTKDAALKSKQ